ncbi:NAD kinase [Limosilactobacillus mucosae]|uniref:NAD kinase n=1 Tax=Limosilactobacillus mucosae TaxID=97478 RepID=A0AAJ1HQR2_LIMMU|nr:MULTISPECIES: NAD kinase [Lactobacillaceae]MDD6454552.1 NAD kinase [Lactobacillus sp.]MDC2828916.1 NAD kinase [Limosilactobacillus mucosae]MDC2838260.1 NAD kinase [Limosilactobacillus mucosae]MDC2838602.1 NAD kinase [Limosilactobacillus mucosae]MDC2842129.1 NAD kinase [Limosilactobacillus mucosae]
MRVAIFNYESPESLRVRKLLLNRLEEETAITYDDQQPDIVITIGGDGTLISAFHHYEDRLSTIRFVGIHTGHLGFYTDWRNFEVEDLVESLQNDSGQSVSYPLLEMSATYDDGEVERRVALNESTLRNIVKTMVCDVYINNQLFERFRGDGLVISTPTGSTAYNKSVGGAILDPRIIGFQLGEMASLNNRVFRTLGSPVVFGSDTKLTLRLPDDSGTVLSCDRDQIMMDTQERRLIDVSYRVSDKVIRFAKYRHTNFWDRVKDSFIGGIQ